MSANRRRRRAKTGRDLVVGVRRSFLLFIPFLFIIYVQDMSCTLPPFVYKKIEFLFSARLGPASKISLRSLDRFFLLLVDEENRALQEKGETFLLRLLFRCFALLCTVCAYLPKNPPCS